MNTEFFEALTLLEKEKDIKKEYMLEKITAAIIAAVKKEKNMDMQPENIASFFDEEKKTVRFFVRKEVVENVENPLTEIDLASAKKINKKYVSGKHTNNGTTLLISNGFHKESNDQHRFMTYDEINIIKLKK